MSHLSPTTLTQAEQRTILRATAGHPRDHLIISLALGTGLRLGEIVGLNVGDVFNGNGRPRTRIRIRAEIAKGGKAGDVFLPDKLWSSCGGSAGSRSSDENHWNPTRRCSATSRGPGSRNAESSSCGGSGSSGPDSIGCIRFIAFGTRR